jgi:hypothetical protein
MTASHSPPAVQSGSESSRMSGHTRSVPSRILLGVSALAVFAFWIVALAVGWGATVPLAILG